MRGTFGNVAKLDTMMCIAFGKTADTCYTGGGNGNIYVWSGESLAKSVKAHEGPCFAMHSLDKVCLPAMLLIITCTQNRNFPYFNNEYIEKSVSSVFNSHCFAISWSNLSNSNFLREMTLTMGGGDYKIRGGDHKILGPFYGGDHKILGTFYGGDYKINF